MRLYFQLVLFLVSGIVQAQTTVSGSFVHDGIVRTYSFYVPATYIPGQEVPLLLNLHGTGTDGASQAQNRDFRPIADTANFIVVHPDGTTLAGQRFWNYGNVFGSTVDDVGFLVALIDTIAAQYSINANRVYSVGMSNGGFMSYYLACQTNRFAAIGSVTGSMGVTMYNNCSPVRPTPVIHIHGTDDPINPYAGNSTSKGIEEVVLYWANQNGCDTVPIITAVPDIDNTDDATAERYLYTGGINGHTVEHYKVTGGGHTWPGSNVPSALAGNTCMDFSASAEVWRFLSRYEIANGTSIAVRNTGGASLYPNPPQGMVIIQSTHLISHLQVMDLQGQVVATHTAENIQQVNLNHLPAGTYFVCYFGTGIERLIVLPK